MCLPPLHKIRQALKIKQHLLIEELQRLTSEAMTTVNRFKDLPLQALNHKPKPQSWSALECIEHLRLYGNFYLPEIEKALRNAPKIENSQDFNSGVLGNYFVGVIKVDSKKKMKATKEMDSTGSNLTIATIEQFQSQVEKLQQLLDSAQKVNLAKVTTAISFTKLIELRLGDTLRFLIYHNERHLAQAERALEKAN